MYEFIDIVLLVSSSILLIFLLYILVRKSSEKIIASLVLPIPLSVIVHVLYGSNPVWIDYLTAVWYLAVITGLLRKGAEK